MRRLLLILLLPLLAGAQTVELSALNYGTHNGMTAEQRDAKFLADTKAPLDNHIKSADLEPILYHYTYTINDSAYSLIDAPGDSIKVLVRFVNYAGGNIVECPVELTWATISKHSPAKVSMAKYKGWQGGPHDLKIKPVNVKAATAIGIVKKAAVDVAMKDGKEWTEKISAKKLTEKEKRAAAWKIETGKAKPDDYTKTNKVKP